MSDLKSINAEQGLYVLKCGSGFSCLGFEVTQERMTRLANEMGVPVPVATLGTAEHYEAYRALLAKAAATGKRFQCELSPQLIGLEGWRVEVEEDYGERKRFIVGKSTGWLPIHLEIASRRSHGGMAADRIYKTVRRLERVR
jgi:hypothetical protein